LVGFGLVGVGCLVWVFVLVGGGWGLGVGVVGGWGVGGVVFGGVRGAELGDGWFLCGGVCCRTLSPFHDTRHHDHAAGNKFERRKGGWNLARPLKLGQDSSRELVEKSHTKLLGEDRSSTPRPAPLLRGSRARIQHKKRRRRKGKGRTSSTRAILDLSNVVTAEGDISNGP